MKKIGFSLRPNATGYIKINTRLCEGCGKCIAVCSKGVLRQVGFLFHKHVVVVNPEKCTGCRRCEKVCRRGAIGSSYYKPRA
ncbi:MAG: 4Fe-4S dicluster domain-containing protein [Peptococcaceae bacterium]